MGVWGMPSMFFNVNGGRFQISDSTLQGHFLTLMMGAPGSPSTPARGSPLTFLNVDGGRSWISVSTRQGARRRCFLTLMVGASGSPSPLGARR
jgi:hypothetical protein